jgi:uncharacterized protein (DUF362 family)
LYVSSATGSEYNSPSKKKRAKRVAILETEQPTADEVRKGIDLVGGFPNVDKYIIKPNLCLIRSPPVTTRLEIVKYTIECIKKVNPEAEVAIVESDATAVNATSAFNQLGFARLKEMFTGVRLVNLSKDRTVKAVVDGKIIRTLTMPTTFLDYDVMVNITSLKTHVLFKASLGMKNLFGLIPSKKRIVLHPFLDDILVDLAQFYNPHLTIIDGSYGMEGRGPIDGITRKCGALIFGNNVVATDMIAAKYMGFKPSDIHYLKLAMMRFCIKEKDIILTGDAGLLDNPQLFKTISQTNFKLIRSGLLLSRLGSRVTKFGEFVTLSGDALSFVDKESRRRKLPYRDIIQLARNMITKIDV